MHLCAASLDSKRGGILVRRTTLFVLIAVLLGAGYIHYICFNFCSQKEDIFYHYSEGDRMLRGQNPYQRISDSNMRDNDKFATYSPLFYFLGALVQKVGLKNFPDWLKFWRLVFGFFNFGIIGILFFNFFKRNMFLLAILASLFWAFNRWTINLIIIANIDFLAIFFLLLSVTIRHRHRPSAHLLLGLSLAIKHLAVFIVPLYLIEAWCQSSDSAKMGKKIKKLSLATLQIGSILFLVSFPFLVRDAWPFIKSILFHLTRAEASNLAAPSISFGLGLKGLWARVPMLVLMTFVFVLFARRRFGFYTASLLTFTLFINFSPVLFKQYIAWSMLFVPLIVLDASERRDSS